MKSRVVRVARYAAYPLGYLLLFALCVRLTFPYDRVKDRILAEFHAHQKGADASTLEIDEVGGHWLFGIQADGVRLIGPPPKATSDEEAKKPSVLSIDEFYASASLLRLLIGTVFVDFGASLGGGEVEGYFRSDDEESAVSLTLEGVDVGAVTPLGDIVGLPLSGALAGSVNLSLPEGKMSRADGELELNATDLEVGDGKAKVRGTIALPRLDAGNLELSAAAVQGRLDLRKFSAKGKDFELAATGSLALRDPIDQSLSDLRLRFKFTDSYKNKNDLTKGLFGDPGSKVPGLFDLDPSIKRAKTSDGFYGWRVSGQLANLNFRPAPSSGEPRSKTSSRRRGSSTKLSNTKRDKAGKE